MKLDYPKDRFEVILIDNNSTDSSEDIARSYPITVLREENVQSAYASRNRGIKEARGEMIAFTDADCIVTPRWLKELAGYWSDGSAGCFCGEIEAYNPTSMVEKYSARREILSQKWTLADSYLPFAQTANSAFRKEVFDKIGLFITEAVSGGDAEMTWRMQKRLGLKIKYIPEALVYHKHRSTVVGLYRQFKKYEHAKLLWKMCYTDYPVPSVQERYNEFLSAFKIAVRTFPSGMKKCLMKQIDTVDLASPFFDVVINLGTLAARLGKSPEVSLKV
jgi:cellulose synthase/poly-beta-1,6-N-acetylglucosamine synthase-like glycosyltransferase